MSKTIGKLSVEVPVKIADYEYLKVAIGCELPKKKDETADEHRERQVAYIKKQLKVVQDKDLASLAVSFKQDLEQKIRDYLGDNRGSTKKKTK